MTIAQIELFTVLALSGSALLALMVAAVALGRVSRLRHQIAELVAQVESAAENHAGLSAAAVGQSAQLARLEQDVLRLRDRMDMLEATAELSGTVLGQAIRMAREGCAAQEIVETCGLSEAEADFLVLMHRRGRID